MNSTTKTILALLLVLFLASCASESTVPAPVPAQTENTLPITNETRETTTHEGIPDGTYTLDSAQSTLTYSASRIAGTPHIGTVAIKDGTLTLAKPNADGTFTIDMTTITESKDNQRFLTHLKSKDFFDVENHPLARMNINSIEHTTDESYLVNGDLTILNTTQPLTFPATLTLEGKTLHATANFTIDRTRWNITYDSGSIFSELGDRAIKDEVGFTLDLAFSAP